MSAFWLPAILVSLHSRVIKELFKERSLHNKEALLDLELILIVSFKSFPFVRF